jgi:hypothetical protein
MALILHLITRHRELINQGCHVSDVPAGLCSPAQGIHTECAWVMSSCRACWQKSSQMLAQHSVLQGPTHAWDWAGCLQQLSQCVHVYLYLMQGTQLLPAWATTNV